MKFWKKSSTTSRNRSVSINNNSLSRGSLNSNDDDYIISKRGGAEFATTSVPTRHERMQLLNSIIHHADAVQSQFLPPKSDASSEVGGSKILRSNSNSLMKQMNDKAYQRWHQVLQEGLVPMAVRGLGLLEKVETLGESSCKFNDEEEEYFLTLQGMEEEIQMMAILARAASHHVRHAKNEESAAVGDMVETNSPGDGMEQINSMMKCSAMLMFYVVMMASTPSSADTSSSSGETMARSPTASTSTDANAITKASAAGYDGRVRHVLKMSCVDVLTNAILRTIEAYEANNEEDGKSADNNEVHSESKMYDVDEYTLWNVPNIKKFVDEHQIGKEAIFGTVWSKKVAEHSDLGEKQGSKTELQPQEKDSKNATDNAIKPEKAEETDEFPSIKEMHSDLLLTDESEEESTQDVDHASNRQDDIQEQHIQKQVERLWTYNETANAKAAQVDGTNLQLDNREIQEEQTHQTIDPEIESQLEEELELQDEEKAAHLAKRQLNAKFLATRKFELIERIVAIDVVRFLMAEERERKLREKELKEQKPKFMNVVEMVMKAKEDDTDSRVADFTDGDASEKAGEEMDNDNANQDSQNGSVASPETSSAYWTSHRKKQMLRSLKIAGVGLTLGTVFAVTGGLAAPALAAGLGGLAALTGAGTASSTAVLAVLATFKAGAVLFGVGGGGISAYKMKKRTDGLSEFSIRRENIEQYMYPGASEERMKKGIEAMLPHLHTTVAVSGWLRENDVDDFQLAWGICPNGRDEKSKDDAYRIRQLKRFYSVYNPPLVQYCEDFMWFLQRKQKKEFSWDKIWNQIEAKYGANPDRLLPVDKPQNDEIVLSLEEKEMIDGVLNKTKIVVGKQRGFLSCNIDFNESDEIIDFLGKVSPTKDGKPIVDDDDDDDKIGTSLVENLENRMMNEDISSSVHINNETEYSSDKSFASSVEENEKAHSSPRSRSDNDSNTTPSSDPQSVDKSADNEAEGHERSPLVWDWARLYGSDLHTVTWESKMLSSLCHIVENMAMEVSTQATKAALQYSVIGAIITAVALPSALLTASKLIDDPYQIVVIRADEAGKELAKCLLQSDERRPVTLVGFSFGARVIYSCLRELARQQEIWEDERSQPATDISASQSMKSKEKFEYDREPASLIADVIFIGLPRVIDKTVLTSCRRVTGGRFVNCYAKNDWLLSLMFVARGGIPCGTKPILDVAGVENYDVTSLVESHTKYADAVPNILKLVRFCEP